MLEMLRKLSFCIIENRYNKLAKTSTIFLFYQGKIQEDEHGENWEDV